MEKGPVRRRQDNLRMQSAPRKNPQPRGQRGAPEMSQPEPGADRGVFSAPEERQPYDGNTAYKLYLREVSQTKLLTREEEAVLAQRIQLGDQKAREQMIKANLRLVVKIAREYEDYGMPLLDLISEGNVGLMRAVERFDPTKGAKLSTYGGWWIKQSIKRALANQSKTIRLPVHVVDKLYRLNQTSAKLQEVLGREPTDAELGEEMGFSAAKVVMWRKAGMRPVSLDAPLGNDSDSSPVAETVADENTSTPYEQLAVKASAHMVRQLVSNLQPRELEILRYRFGLDGEAEQTLDQVGLKFGLTRERIRQLEYAAICKLRRGIAQLENVRVAA
jgi:RNA polymerase primary sigma factor